jgi:hypothetical protein
MLPASLLEKALTYSKLDKILSAEGITPVIKFVLILSSVKPIKPPTADGIEPLIRFAATRSILRFDKNSIVIGMLPDIRLPYASSCCNFPMETGILPVR